MNSLEIIKNVIFQSELSESDQEELLKVFANEKEEDLEPIAKLLSTEPSWALQLSKNLKAKQAVLRARDPKLWQRILKEEESQLDSMD